MSYLIGDHSGWLAYVADSWSALALATFGLCIRIIRRRITRVEVKEDCLTIELDIEGLFGGRKRTRAKPKSDSL